MIKLMVIFGGGDEGGGPAYLKSLLKGIDKERFEVVYLSLGRDSLADELADYVSAVEVLEGRQGMLVGSVKSVKKAVRRHGTQLIHTHGFRANFAGRLAGRSLGVPVVTTVHSVISTDYANPFKALLAPRIDNITLALTGRFIAISNAIKEDLSGRGVPPEKISVVYNGIDPYEPSPDRDAARAALGGLIPVRELGRAGEDAFIVGTVARLEPNKGVINLVRAVKKLTESIPGLRVIIIGSGIEREALEKEASTLGVSNVVEFLGYQLDVRRLIPGFDVFALPSLSEGFGLVIVEAMAAGVPVVASRVGGIPEIIDHEKSGLLVEPGDPRALGHGVARLYESSSLRSSIAEEAAKIFIDRFTTDRFVKATEKVLEKMISASH